MIVNAIRPHTVPSEPDKPRMTRMARAVVVDSPAAIVVILLSSRSVMKCTSLARQHDETFNDL